MSVFLLAACHRSPTEPDAGPLATGRWTGDGACLSVTETGCNLAVGCGHGQFPRPSIRSDGTFDADGTYRLEVGPVSINPAPPAHYSGSVNGSRLMEMHQIRRVPVVDEHGRCIGIISQADVAAVAQTGQVAELIRTVSRET